MKIELAWKTPPAWLHLVRHDLDAFLQDHAANERKVSGSALRLAVQHPERTELVDTLIDVAHEELEHFRLIYRLLKARGVPLGRDTSDPYTGRLHRAVRTADVDRFLLDRLVLFAIIEARGGERFALVAEGLDDPELCATYAALARAEARHHALYLRLARAYFEPALVHERLAALLALEAEVAAALPLRPALH